MWLWNSWWFLMLACLMGNLGKVSYIFEPHFLLTKQLQCFKNILSSKHFRESPGEVSFACESAWITVCFLCCFCEYCSCTCWSSCCLFLSSCPCCCRLSPPKPMFHPRSRLPACHNEIVPMSGSPRAVKDITCAMYDKALGKPNPLVC